MPDLWESATGLNPGSNDSAGDADGDQKSNLEEYIANTDPQDESSLFVVEILSTLEQLNWDQRPERIYRIFQTLELMEGWTLLEDHAAPPVSVDFSEPAGFYKVEVRVPDP